MTRNTMTNPFATPTQNPFLTPAAREAVAADAPEGSYEYRVKQSAPEPSSEECESSAQAVEVRVSWGRNTLRVVHLSPVRAFYVGETVERRSRCDVLVPAEKLGCSRAPLVTVKGGAARVVLLPGARGTVELPGAAAMTVAEMVASGRAEPCAELAGAHQIALPLGAHVRMELGELCFELAGVKHGRKVAGGLLAAFGAASLMCIGGSALAHGAFLGTMAAVMPDTSSLSDDSVTEDQRFLMKHYLDSVADREDAGREDARTTEVEQGQEGGQSGTRAKGSSGLAGSPTSSNPNGRLAVAGPANNEDPRIARARALKEAADFGMIGLLNTMDGGDTQAPIADWGSETAEGRDAASANGHIWGENIGDAAGWGGLDLTGTGEGADGKGEGIGLDGIRTIGGGFGNVPGQGFCRGLRCGGTGVFTGPGHKVRPPSARALPPETSGHGIPAEVIQRIVRQNFGRFRMCYESGLRNNPNLQGRVAVSFVIDRSGRVSTASGGGDLPDSSVTACVARQFYSLNFPQPEGGVVTVTYPILFTPGS